MIDYLQACSTYLQTQFKLAATHGSTVMPGILEGIPVTYDQLLTHELERSTVYICTDHTDPRVDLNLGMLNNFLLNIKYSFCHGDGFFLPKYIESLQSQLDSTPPALQVVKIQELHHREVQSLYNFLQTSGYQNPDELCTRFVNNCTENKTIYEAYTAQFTPVKHSQIELIPITLGLALLLFYFLTS